MIDSSASLLALRERLAESFSRYACRQRRLLLLSTLLLRDVDDRARAAIGIIII